MGVSNWEEKTGRNTWGYILLTEDGKEMVDVSHLVIKDGKKDMGGLDREHETGMNRRRYSDFEQETGRNRWEEQKTERNLWELQTGNIRREGRGGRFILGTKDGKDIWEILTGNMVPE
ncbi:hypothetical protein LSAT2_008793 [Lamellibrachia satsuma]|nr:hypothetical protein LSAT2_008793 [Lamellibrachia satsuma]